MKERKDKEVYKVLEYNSELQKWQKKLRELMPENYKYKALPMFFCYNDPERIKSAVTKNPKSQEFFMVDDPDATFALCVKVFPYPGGFNSIRIILAIFTPFPDDEIPDDDLSQEGLDDLEEGADDWLGGME